MAFFRFFSSEDPAAASAPHPEALQRQAKYRLLGAVVLVVLAVIGFPMLVDKQPRPISSELRIEFPDKTTAPALAPPAPVALSGAAAPGAVVEPVEPNRPVRSTPAVVSAQASLSNAESIAGSTAAAPSPKPSNKPASTASAQAKPEAEPKPAPKPDARSEAKPDKPADPDGQTRVVIQVGAFEDSKKITEVRSKLERAGIKTYIQVVDTKDGKRTRVRAGPFASKAEAEKAAEKIKKLDLPASLLTL